MKTISTLAMNEITKGSAIVAGALEIIPRAAPFQYETVGTVDLDAVANLTNVAANGASVGVTLSGFAPTDVLRFTLPAGGTYTAWNFQGGGAGWWVNDFELILDGDHANRLRVSEAGVAVPWTRFLFGLVHQSAALARAAFGEQFITGAADYTFYLHDDGSDNSGGLSILVEKQVSGTGATPPPIRVWGGYSPLTIDGNVYDGIGDHGLVQRTAGAIGGVAQGLQLTLSGIEPALLNLLDGDEVKGAATVIRRLIFAEDGKSLYDAEVFDRGRVDTVETSEVIGGSAAITLAIETAARGLGSSGARMRSDSDQRLINPTDGYFRNTAYAGEKMLYWGGRKPARGGGLSSAVGSVFNPVGVRSL